MVSHHCPQPLHRPNGDTIMCIILIVSLKFLVLFSGDQVLLNPQQHRLHALLENLHNFGLEVVQNEPLWEGTR